MCIIVYKPAGKDVKKKVLRECMDTNPDGAGFSYAAGGELVICKGYFDFDALWRDYRKVISAQRNPDVVLHFRMATHGKINRGMCHPFRCGDLAVAHNGVIGIRPRHKSKSDTFEFCSSILADLPEGWLSNLAVWWLVESAIGSSRLAMMDESGDVHIFNEDLGLWDGGIWYSNTGYRPVTRKRSNVVWSGHGKSNYPSEYWDREAAQYQTSLADTGAEEYLAMCPACGLDTPVADWDEGCPECDEPWTSDVTLITVGESEVVT